MTKNIDESDDKYKQLDELNESQNLFFALAVYDWNFFGDARIYRLKSEDGITVENKDIFTYYYTNKPYAIEINNDRYTSRYKELLQAVIAVA